MDQKILLIYLYLKKLSTSTPVQVIINLVRFSCRTYQSPSTVASSVRLNETTPRWKKELLSIVESLEHFRNLLLGFNIVIYSDHKNLSFDTFKSERVRRWRLILDDYTFVYTPGKDNLVADLLSWYPAHPITSQEAEINTIDDEDANDPPYFVDFRLLAQHQHKDATLQALLKTQDYEQLQVYDEFLIFFNMKVCLPSSLIDTVIT